MHISTAVKKYRDGLSLNPVWNHMACIAFSWPSFNQGQDRNDYSNPCTWSLRSVGFPMKSKKPVKVNQGLLLWLQAWVLERLGNGWSYFTVGCVCARACTFVFLMGERKDHSAEHLGTLTLTQMQRHCIGWMVKQHVLLLQTFSCLPWQLSPSHSGLFCPPGLVKQAMGNRW